MTRVLLIVLAFLAGLYLGTVLEARNTRDCYGALVGCEREMPAYWSGPEWQAATEIIYLDDMDPE
jgi:hypothetical protein